VVYCRCIKYQKRKEKVGDFEEKRFESIGPTVGQELKKSAFYQLGLVSLGIILYIAYAFRKVAKPITPWQYSYV
jgi:preprotein translocase subunit SecF